MYPVTLNVRGRRCLVVGGGAVALRKVLGLLEEGAKVTVITPEAVPDIEAQARDGRVSMESREYRAGDVAGVALAIVAVDDEVGFCVTEILDCIAVSSVATMAWLAASRAASSNTMSNCPVAGCATE